MASENTVERARLALPHLVHCAKHRRTITYGELATRIGTHHRPVRYVLGYIRDHICITRDVPLINSLVVNQDTGMPGESWLPGGTAHLDPEEQKYKFEVFRDDVFAFDAWDQLLSDLGLEPIESTDTELEEQARAYAVRLERVGPSGESDFHKGLKRYVARHPNAIGLYPVRDGTEEYLFPSGDRCDVVFDLGSKGHAVVEVKKSYAPDLVRGLYQAVKYRALMEAEQGHGESYQVSAHLVADEIPSGIERLGRTLAIRCHAVDHSAPNLYRKLCAWSPLGCRWLRIGDTV
jgi:hypothetical protein